TREIASDLVSTLVILGGNPVLSAPADLKLGEILERVPLRVHLSLYEDETSTHCHWNIPAAHAFEAWVDARAFDGSATILQPLIAPLYEGKSAHEVVAALSGEASPSGHDIVKGFWRKQSQAPDFEHWWRRALHDGLVSGSALPPKSVHVNKTDLST